MQRDILIDRLLAWFAATKRQLPWRTSYDPYHVWISEIMLQQTQMERGVAYFRRWTERFPDVREVAAASEEEILKYWEGLGYYARARNLHRAAKVLVRDFGAQVPCDYQQLLSLPGIGPYTAAAIASVAGNVDIAVVDANVLRVFARLFDIEGSIKQGPIRKRIERLADEMLPRGKARRYNQALMDLGGLICTPKSPNCPSCPVTDHCLALARSTVALRPELSRPKKTVFQERLAVLIRDTKGGVYIQKRPENGVWGGLWEFPGGRWPGGTIDGGDAERLVQAEVGRDCGLRVGDVALVTTVSHQYTHHRITLHCFTAQLQGDKGASLREAVEYRWVAEGDLREYGFPAGCRKFLEYFQEKGTDLFF